MALTQRFFRLFQADLHGVLDRLEEPEVLLRQAVREMEEELERMEMVVKRLSTEKDGIARRQLELSESLASAGQELNLCFEAGDEALARSTVKRKLELEKLSKHLERKSEELEAGLRERRAQLAENRNHYESVRQKAEVLTEEKQAGSTGQDGDYAWPVQDFSVRDEEVDIALLRERQRRASAWEETP